MFRAAAVCFALSLLPNAYLAAADFSGVWKGKTEFAGGQMMELTYDLKVQGDKITGTVETQRGKLEIADGKIKGDEFTFTTKRGEVSVNHVAKWSDGKIKISVHTANGDREYTLERAVDVTGHWDTVVKLPDGTEFPLKYEFKSDGGKLTGTVEGPAGPIDLRDVKLAGDTLTYKATIGDNEVNYEGKVADGKIKVKSHGGPFGDREYTLTRPLELAGLWETKFTGGDGTEIPLTFEFKVDGDKLTGTVEGPLGKLPLSNGKISGDEISFEVDVNGTIIKYKANAKPGEFKLKSTGFDQEWELTMKRAAKK